MQQVRSAANRAVCGENPPARAKRAANRAWARKSWPSRPTGHAADCKTAVAGPFKAGAGTGAFFKDRSGEDHVSIIEQAKALGPVAELEQKVAADPLDHQARFDLATALNAQGKRAEATAQLLEIVRRDRKWNEDGARKQLVQLFEAWGPTDEATVEGRKRLSTILFS
jgi:hypothetical protein